MKCPGLDGRDAKGALHVRKLRGLVSGVQGMGIRAGKRRNLSRDGAEEEGREKSKPPHAKPAYGVPDTVWEILITC